MKARASKRENNKNAATNYELFYLPEFQISKF